MDATTVLTPNSTVNAPFSPAARSLLCSSCKLQSTISSLSPPFNNPLLLLRSSRTRRLQSLGIGSSGGRGSLVFSVRRNRITCGITEIGESEFADVVLKSNRPVLVEFVANWCGPCRLISPAMDAIAQEYGDRLAVVKVDHDANPKLIGEYKVYGLPTLILFKDGEEVPESRREGAITKVKLKEYVDALLDSASVV
ncbi:hypothetical protein Ancab_029142 [Ancistrocladus abbreviatus]